jgi:transposase
MEDEGARLTYAELAFARRALQEGDLRLKEKVARAAKLARRLAMWQERINQLKDSDRPLGSNVGTPEL